MRSIRVLANSMAFKLVIVLVIATFLFYGISGVINSKNIHTVLKFKDAQKISNQDVQELKNMYLRNAAMQGVDRSLLEENELYMKQIDDIALEKLINNRLIDHLVKQYDINVANISENEYRQIVKNPSLFEELSDIKSNFLPNSPEKILEYLILTDIFKNNYFNNSFYKKMLEIASEKRTFDLYKFDLEQMKILESKVADDDINDFYKQNSKMFQTPEKRSFAYIVVSKFNQDDIKKIEDDIASGKNITELSNDVGVDTKKIKEIKDITYDELKNDQNSILSEIVDSIFEAGEGEVSYPLDARSEKIIFEIRSIEKSNIKPLENIKDEVKSILVKKIKKEEILKIVSIFKKEYSEAVANNKGINELDLILKKYNVTNVKSSIKISRNGIDDEVQHEKISNFINKVKVFGISQIGDFSSPEIFEDSAYLYFLKGVTYDESKAIDNENNDFEVKKMLQNVLLDDLLNYLKKEQLSN